MPIKKQKFARLDFFLFAVVIAVLAYAVFGRVFPKAENPENTERRTQCDESTETL